MLSVYAAGIEAVIQGCAIVVAHNLSTVQLSPNTGYVEGEVTFVNGSRLAFFEFLRQSVTGLDREKYRYHFMNVGSQLVFRYDNAPHHPEVDSFPHHRHQPMRVTESAQPPLPEVMAEIEAHVLGIP